jgi:hypothetical protein
MLVSSAFYQRLSRKRNRKCKVENAPKQMWEIAGNRKSEDIVKSTTRREDQFRPDGAITMISEETL